MTTRTSDDAWVRYSARPSCVLGLLWIGVADLVGVTRGWAAVAVEAAGGSVVGQVDSPQDAGGTLGDRAPAGATHVGGDPAGQRRREASPEASVAPARSRIAMSAAGTRPIILTSMALLAGERIPRGWPPPSRFRWGLLLSQPRPWLPASG